MPESRTLRSTKMRKLIDANIPVFGFATNSVVLREYNPQPLKPNLRFRQSSINITKFLKFDATNTYFLPLDLFNIDMGGFNLENYIYSLSKGNKTFSGNIIKNIQKPDIVIELIDKHLVIKNKINEFIYPLNKASGFKFKITVNQQEYNGGTKNYSAGKADVILQYKPEPPPPPPQPTFYFTSDRISVDREGLGDYDFSNFGYGYINISNILSRYLVNKSVYEIDRDGVSISGGDGMFLNTVELDNDNNEWKLSFKGPNSGTCLLFVKQQTTNVTVYTTLAWGVMRQD